LRSFSLDLSSEEFSSSGQSIAVLWIMQASQRILQSNCSFTLLFPQLVYFAASRPHPLLPCFFSSSRCSVFKVQIPV